MNDLTGDLEHDSDLCNSITYIPVSCSDSMIVPNLTTNAAALRFTAYKDSIKSGRN